MKQTLCSNVKMINQYHRLGHFFIHITTFAVFALVITVIIVAIVAIAAAARADVVCTGRCAEYLYRLFVVLFITSKWI